MERWKRLTKLYVEMKSEVVKYFELTLATYAHASAAKNFEKCLGL